jgi:hypothetical protein
MKKVFALVLVSSVSHAQPLQAPSTPTFNWNGLSADDVQVIGRALDKLPREETDRNNLYQRLQAQITQQANAFAKAKADADKATEATKKETPP